VRVRFRGSGSLKASPLRLIKAQWKTYVDANTGRIRWQDHVVFEGLPLVVLGICIWRDVHLGTTTATALLTATSLLGALLFGVMLQVSGRAMDWADTKPTPSEETSFHAKYLEELAANAGYASLVCIVDAMVFVVAATASKQLLEAASGIGLALGTHLILVLLMVMKRVFALTQERLTRARTGADQPRTIRRRDAA
jgi:hypothetical protein